MIPKKPQGQPQVAEYPVAGLVCLHDSFPFLSLLRLLP